MKQISLHQLCLLLIILVIQQNTASAMDCPGCNKRFNKSVNLVNHYNKNHTNREFYLYTQDKNCTPKQNLKKNTKSYSKQTITIKREQHLNKPLQDRLMQRFLLELPQRADFKMEFPQQDSFQTNNYIVFPEFPTSVHNTDYLEWTEK